MVLCHCFCRSPQWSKMSLLLKTSKRSSQCFVRKLCSMQMIVFILRPTQCMAPKRWGRNVNANGQRRNFAKPLAAGLTSQHNGLPQQGGSGVDDPADLPHFSDKRKFHTDTEHTGLQQHSCNFHWRRLPRRSIRSSGRRWHPDSKASIYHPREIQLWWFCTGRLVQVRMQNFCVLPFRRSLWHLSFRFQVLRRSSLCEPSCHLRCHCCHCYRCCCLSHAQTTLTQPNSSVDSGVTSTWKKPPLFRQRLIWTEEFSYHGRKTPDNWTCDCLGYLTHSFFFSDILHEIGSGARLVCNVVMTPD